MFSRAGILCMSFCTYSCRCLKPNKVTEFLMSSNSMKSLPQQSWQNKQTVRQAPAFFWGTGSPIQVLRLNYLPKTAPNFFRGYLCLSAIHPCCKILAGLSTSNKRASMRNIVIHPLWDTCAIRCPRKTRTWTHTFFGNIQLQGTRTNFY